MDLVTVRQIYKDREQYLNKEISIGGWVRSLRDSKAFGFIVLSDGTYFETLQVVYHDTMENFSEISKLRDSGDRNRHRRCFFARLPFTEKTTQF